MSAATKRADKLQFEITKHIELAKADELTADDYMDLFVAVRNATAQGSGLVWSEVREMVEFAMNKTFERSYSTSR